MFLRIVIFFALKTTNSILHMDMLKLLDTQKLRCFYSIKRHVIIQDPIDKKLPTIIQHINNLTTKKRTALCSIDEMIFYVTEYCILVRPGQLPLLQNISAFFGITPNHELTSALYNEFSKLENILNAEVKHANFHEAIEQKITDAMQVMQAKDARDKTLAIIRTEINEIMSLVEYNEEAEKIREDELYYRKTLTQLCDFIGKLLQENQKLLSETALARIAQEETMRRIIAEKQNLTQRLSILQKEILLLKTKLVSSNNMEALSAANSPGQSTPATPKKAITLPLQLDKHHYCGPCHSSSLKSFGALVESVDKEFEL